MTRNRDNISFVRIDRHRRSKVIGALVMSFLVGIFFISLLPKRKPRSNEVQSFLNLSVLSIGLAHYFEDTGGELPAHLFELVPNYIDNGRYLRLFPVGSDFSSEDVVRSKEFLDREGAYVYVGRRGYEAGILAYERLDLWPSNSNWRENVSVLVTNFTVKSMNRTTLKSLLSRLEPPGQP